jgi:zinc/manganese transport system ATP-binding protein
VAHGATDTVLTAENLFRARQMSEAFDDDANVCARPAEQPAKRGAA